MQYSTTYSIHLSMFSESTKAKRPVVTFAASTKRKQSTNQPKYKMVKELILVPRQRAVDPDFLSPFFYIIDKSTS